MNDILDRLQKDHREFQRIAEYLERDMDRCLHGDKLDLEVLEEFIEYCSAHADRFHHPLEDQVCARLVEAYPAARNMVRDLERDHLNMCWATRDLQDMLNAMHSDHLIPRDRFLEALGEYLGLFYQHIRTEEMDIFPLATRHLTESDWAMLTDWMNDNPTVTGTDPNTPRCPRSQQLVPDR